MRKKTVPPVPRVIVHNATSIDNRITGFEVDLATYYRLVSTWHEEATLVGSGTILASPEGRVADKPDPGGWQPDPTDRRPLLVIADSRGRVRCWQTLRRAGYWRDVVALCSARTPRRFRDFLRAGGVDCIVTGGRRVDLRAALAALRREYGIRVVRCDSGGELNAALMQAGLVDEVSLLVHPTLAGERNTVPMFRLDTRPAGLPAMRLYRSGRLGRGLVWLRYRLSRP